MRVSAEGMAFIQRFEGFSATPYVCPAGMPTIGYGHVIRPHDQLLQVSTAQAMALLQADLVVVEAAIGQLIQAPLKQQQFDALASFTFNLGTGALQRSTLRRVINRGEHAAVPKQLMRWVWAGGHRLPGLVKRRAAEGILYGQSE